MPHTHFDESTEEYLEAIYRLEREGPGATTSGLASELGVAPASVSGMLKKLASDGYVLHPARGEARLTERGLEIAVRVMRRHRLAECLLTDVLGMSWDEVHAEACRLEHAISARVEERLVAVLGNPQVCPHGHPIPPADGSDPPRPGVPLAQLSAGESARVHGVTEEVPEILRYLAEISLRPGTELRVLAKAPLGGPMTLEIAGARHAISLELARLIIVISEDRDRSDAIVDAGKTS
ncbi:MAG TPA: metal-dependent transcriptional regulator [Candidatus Baltobacteraceae bacterium]|jgi:DtxR family Mn-dependent transcriptional regulator|nr:metal-dependent transcriptional regulator [Candidatus Baltobacteraceae bacterium]